MTTARKNMDAGNKLVPRPSVREKSEFIGATLFFLDSMGGTLLLPVLPSIPGEFGVESSAVSAAWVGILVGAYYAGRSSTLVSAQLIVPSSSRANFPQQFKPTLPIISTVLALSAATYFACGLAVDRRGVAGLLWLVVLRVISGALAAVHRFLALTCLQNPGSRPPSSCKSPQELAGGFGGLVTGLLLAGALFAPGTTRPILYVCLAAVVAHVLSLASLILVSRRQGYCCGVGACFHGSSFLTSGGYATVQEANNGGGDRELELTRHPHEEDPGDGLGGGTTVAAADTIEVASVDGISGGEEKVLVQDQGEMEIPRRYIRGCNGDVVEATRRWQLTLAWRANERVDEVLQEPQPHFHLIKRHYPHYIHGRARDGCPVWIELPGRIDLPAIRSGGVSTEALRRHYVFVTEYLWNVVEPDFDHGKVVTILDMQGVRMRDLAGEALGFLKQATSIVQDHYMERSQRMFVINAPSFFSLIWRVVRPMLNERTQEKITIISSDTKKIAAALLDCIPPESVPPQYGGTCPVELGKSEEEANLRAHVDSVNASLEPYHGKEEDEEVEVDFRPEDDPRSGAPADRDVFGGDSPRRDSVSADTCNGNDGSGAARRVFRSLGGALGWAGSKLAWRRVPVAHLGDENGFEYDDVQQRWVLRDEPSRRGKSCGDRKAKAKAGMSGVVGEKGRYVASRMERSMSTESSSSEEMTVLAIQAAHLSRTGVDPRLAPVPTATFPLCGGTGHDTARLPRWDAAPPDTRSKKSFASGGSTEANRATVFIRDCDAPEHRLELSCPRRTWPRGHGRWSFDSIGVFYAVSTALRESLPVWLLVAARQGGMGVTSFLVGVVFAAGIMLAETGRAAAAAGWLGPSLRVDDWGAPSEESYSRVLFLARVRLVMVAVLGLLYLLSKVLTVFGEPSILILVVAAAVVAVNHVSLNLCSSLLLYRSAHFRGGSLGVIEGHEEEKQRVASSAEVSRVGSLPKAMLISGSIVAGDVLGSTAGPLLLALALSTGWPYPLDSSCWLVLCLCGDVCVLLGSKEVGAPHARQPNGGGSGFVQIHSKGQLDQFV